MVGDDQDYESLAEGALDVNKAFQGKKSRD
jgi:hypothetical protein